MLLSAELFLCCASTLIFFYLPVLILATTVICMELQVCLSQVVGLQEVVHHTNDCIGPLSCLRSLIDKVVDLPK